MQDSERAYAQDCLPGRQPVPVILINLDRSGDRLATVRAEFTRVGLAFERFPAVNGTELPPSVRPYFCDASGEIVAPLRAGEIGCYASHLAVWQRIAAGSYGQAVLLCEDDIGLPDDFAALLGRLLHATPSGWDVIRLSSETKRSVAVVASLGNGRRLVRYWQIPPWSGAYLVSRAGAAKLLKPGIRHRPIDNDLSHPWFFNVDEYGVSPAPVIQDTAHSIIQTMGGRERAPFHRTELSRAVNKVRKLAYNIRRMGPRRWLGCFAREHGFTARSTQGQASR